MYERDRSLLFARPGAGKTGAVLTVLKELLRDKVIKRALVSAPLRVAELVWEQETQQWDHLADLPIAVATGTPAERKAALESKARIVVTNHENLIDTLEKCGDAFDCLVIDELSKFKGGTSARWQPLMKYTKDYKIKIGMTGSPASAGPQDLFGQVRAIDDGVALGRRWDVWQRTNMYEVVEHVWKPHKDTLERTLQAIEHFTYILSPKDWKPPHVRHERVAVALPKRIRRLYEELDEHMVVDIDGEDLLPGERAQVVNKLRQLCAGFYYDETGKGRRLDHFRLDALEDIIDRQSSPVLLIYDYKEQLEELKRRYPKAPVLGGSSRKKNAEAVRAWNAGELDLMMGHPLSMGHGLNLQYGGHIMAWASLPWSLDQYEQPLYRIAREGQTEETVSYETVVTNTEEERVIKRLVENANQQDAVFDWIAAAGR